jgi:hypothetical protein
MTTEKTTLPKWTEERTAQLQALVTTQPVTIGQVETFATQLSTNTRSVASKLRKLGYDVELKGDAPSVFSEAESAELTELVNNNPGEFTYVTLAQAFAGGKFTAKQVQGKILALELTASIKEAAKVETPRKYTAEQESQFIKLVNSGLSVEKIADKLNKTVASVRGKALSMLRTGEITGIPKAENPTVVTHPLDGIDVANMTVEEIAKTIGKTARGVKSMLTKQGLNAADYKAKVKAA